MSARPPVDLPVDLVCLPFAGAHMDPFHALRAQCTAARPEVGGLTLTYPGHGRRIGEAAEPTIEGMARDALRHWQAYRAAQPAGPRHTVLVGYSMGSLVGFELTHLMAAAGAAPQGFVAMAATPPPRLSSTDLQVDTDEQLLDHCLQYGLISVDQFASPSLRRLFLPALRNDIVAVDRYAGPATQAARQRPLPPQTALSAIGGASDPTVTHLPAWAQVATGPATVHVHPGGHFFITDQLDAVVADVLAHVERLAERTAA